LATAWAIAAACCGEWSLTLTLMRTVSSGASAVISSARSFGVVLRPSPSMTGCSTVWLVTMSAYDLTRCWVKLLPCNREVGSCVPEVETNSCAVAW